MTSLIVGFGEIGKALHKVLKDYYYVGIHDLNIGFEVDFQCEIMHICFPYSEEFVSEVKRYQELYKPKYTIIHSTVPVGTSRQCGAVFHPVIGQHPNLEKSFFAFKQFFGGKDVHNVIDYFRRVGMNIHIEDNAEPLEIGKLGLTTQYSLNIEYIKDLKKQYDKIKAPFSVYNLMVQVYNGGYEKIGFPEYKLPILNPIQKKQGGHCTIPNCDLWDTPFTSLIKELNNKYET